MARSPIDPYVPFNVQQIEDIPSLQRFLADELHRIAAVTTELLERTASIRGGLMWGAADSMLVDGTPQFVANYANSGDDNVYAFSDPFAGTIQILKPGIYTIKQYLGLEQTDNQQNFSFLMGLDVNGINFGVAAVDVTTNQTNVRTLISSLTRVVATAPVALATTLKTDKDGTPPAVPVNVLNSSFEVFYLQPTDGNQLNIEVLP